MLPRTQSLNQKVSNPTSSATCIDIDIGIGEGSIAGQLGLGDRANAIAFNFVPAKSLDLAATNLAISFLQLAKHFHATVPICCGPLNYCSYTYL